MTGKFNMLFFIIFLYIVNLFPVNNKNQIDILLQKEKVEIYDTNQTATLSLKEKVKITYDLLGEDMYLLDEKKEIFFGIEMGSSINKVFNSYGYVIPPSPSEIPDYDYFYDFPNVHVYVLNNEVKYLSTTYGLDMIKTSRGISVGDKLSKLKKLYGKPYQKRKNENNKLYDYRMGYYRITFELKEREIVRLSVSLKY